MTDRSYRARTTGLTYSIVPLYRFIFPRLSLLFLSSAIITSSPLSHLFSFAEAQLLSLYLWPHLFALATECKLVIAFHIRLAYLPLQV